LECSLIRPRISLPRPIALRPGEQSSEGTMRLR
jgi:hypothetical protein